MRVTDPEVAARWLARRSIWGRPEEDGDGTIGVMPNLIVVVGQEGAGKSTVIRALLPHTPGGAQIDAEDVGQVHPFHMNEAFMTLLWQNVLAVIHNFWRAGYPTVIAGSFVTSHAELARFRERLEFDPAVYVIHLCASKPARDRRRILRAKPSTRELRDWVDAAYPEDTSFRERHGEYTYVRLDNTALSLERTVDLIKRAIPAIYGTGVEESV